MARSDAARTLQPFDVETPAPPSSAPSNAVSRTVALGAAAGCGVGAVVLLLVAFAGGFDRIPADAAASAAAGGSGAAGAGHCAPLVNRGSHSTVEIRVGTPRQTFDIVADTGSNNVIVLSCAAIGRPDCTSSNKCYLGTNRSSTFVAPGYVNGHVPVMQMSFGSGDVEVVRATDVVEVGGFETTMENGVLLMIGNKLDIGCAPFEGILGLGKLDARAEDEDALPEFLSSASIQRFSLCFNDQSTGALRLGTPQQQLRLETLDGYHWSIGFGGISVGSAIRPSPFCAPQDRCGAIPDSGTTLMLGPQAHVDQLLVELCDSWPRCAEAFAAGSSTTRAAVFNGLLDDCGSWLGSEGVRELPSIFLQVSGAAGVTQSLELTGWAYIFETSTALLGTRSCSTAFGATEIQTGLPGPAWIFGTSLFYEYEVHYDLASQPPSMAFVQQSCASCDGHISLVSAAARSRLRTFSGPPRPPSFISPDHIAGRVRERGLAL